MLPTMFTFSREFLEVFDKRFEDTMDAEGRDFILGARDWLEWLRTDVRTKLAVDDVLRDAEAARTALRAIVRRHVPKFVGLRKQLEDLGAPPDRPPPTPPGPNTPGDLEGLALEPYTFRAFDKMALQLEAGEGVFLQPFEPVTDPLAPLRGVLRSKFDAFLGPVELADGSYRQQTEDEKRSRLEKLSTYSLGEVDLAYRREIEAAGMRFFASGARALRLLVEILEVGLTGTWSFEPGWFGDPLSRPPDFASSLMDFSSAVLLAPPSKPEDVQKRRQAMSDWSALLRTLLRKASSVLRARLGERVLLVSAIDRFRLRCELHDVDRLRALALEKTAGGIRQSELRLTQELAKYLFDAGYDTFSEVSRGEGRVDLVQHGEVYVEAKQTNSAGSEATRITKGYHEAMDGVRQFQSMNPAASIKAVVLAIYVLDGPRYAPAPHIPGLNGSPDTHVVVVDLRDSSKRGSKKPLPAVEITVADFLASPTGDDKAS